MKLVVIGLVAALLLGGGAAGAYFYFGKPAEASAGPVDEVKKAESDAKAEAAKKEASSEKPEFVQLDPLILPVIDDTGVTQTITLVISIEAPNEETAKEVKSLTPRLQDAFIQDMYGMLNRKNSMPKGVLQVAYIKQRLNNISVKVLGKDKVNEVLLQVVQQKSL